MSTLLHRLGRDTAGSGVIEFALVIWILIGITFAIIEFGIAMWQYNATVKASFQGVRHAVQSDPVAPGLLAYNGVLDDDLRPGQALDLPAFTVRCTGGTCTCAAGDCSDVGALGYDATAFADIIAVMQPMMPFVPPAELPDRVFVEYNHVGLGFAGRPGSDIVPIVSVGVNNLTYDFIAMSAFGLDDWPIAVGRATMPAEDMDSSWP